MAAWRKKITDHLAEWLCFLGRAIFLINGILLSIASVYLVAKLIWFCVRFLDRVIFCKPW